MAKNLKLNIKNEQLAGALNLSKLKSKLAEKKGEKVKQEEVPSKEGDASLDPSLDKKEGSIAPPKVKARSKSVFADPQASEALKKSRLPEEEREDSSEISLSQAKKEEFYPNSKEDNDSSLSFAQEKKEFKKEALEKENAQKSSPKVEVEEDSFSLSMAKKGLSDEIASPKKETVYFEIPKPEELEAFLPEKKSKESSIEQPVPTPAPAKEAPRLGPTGKHINDLLQKQKEQAPYSQERRPSSPSNYPRDSRGSDSRNMDSRNMDSRGNDSRGMDSRERAPRDFRDNQRPSQGPYAPRENRDNPRSPSAPTQRDSRDGLYVPRENRDAPRNTDSRGVDSRGVDSRGMDSRDGPRQGFTPRDPRDGPRQPFVPRDPRDGPRQPFVPRDPRDGPRQPYTPREGGSREGGAPYAPRDGQRNTGFTPRPYPQDRRPYTPGRPPLSAQNMPLPPKPSVLEGDVKIRERKESSSPGDAAKKGAKFKEFKDIKPAKKPLGTYGAKPSLSTINEEGETIFRKRKKKNVRYEEVQETIRPTTLSVALPISIKDLAQEMKLKASQLISKLFLQGLIVTLNDLLDDETTVQLLGQEFGCDITIDIKEATRIKITDKTIQEEIKEADASKLVIRPPVIAFMGHVDHGKTSLIDAIRSSNRTSGEAGAITQHIGAFKYKTKFGEIAILDTPGHEAFSAMRTRGTQVTDIVVLVVAGDEGIKPQTIEAIQQAKEAKVTIVVAINKCDKPNFNVENVYRQLSEQELLPEAWGGSILTVNCSAVTKEGIDTLLENLALQAEILELQADPTARARGTVIESEMHKGMGVVATVLIQNGSLKKGDCIVLGGNFGKIKTMRNEHNQEITVASPSTPVAITGLSGLPEAGEEFIVVKNEKEAREIAEARKQGMKQSAIQQSKKISMDNLLQKAQEHPKKVLNIVLRADVQGSLEAMKTALQKIKSDKAELSVIFSGVGEVSESDVQLANASKAIILGFHAGIESHAEGLLKEFGVTLKQHNIIYHAVDEVKDLMKGLLDKIAIETEKGKAIVKTTFKSSQHGLIAGCQVTEGVIQRNNHLRVMRDGVEVYKGTIHSLKRVKEDVKEVAKGLECGVLLQNSNDVKENDILEAFEITYITQEL